MTRLRPGFLLPENKALESDEAAGSGVVWEKRPSSLWRWSSTNLKVLRR